MVPGGTATAERMRHAVEGADVQSHLCGFLLNPDVVDEGGLVSGVGPGEGDGMRTGRRDRNRNAHATEARARRRYQPASRDPVHAHLNRLHKGQNAARSPCRLERKRIPAGVQAQRLADAAGALNKRRLVAIRCHRSAPGTAVALDAAADAEGPPDARSARVVLIAAPERRDFELGLTRETDELTTCAKAGELDEPRLCASPL